MKTRDEARQKEGKSEEMKLKNTFMVPVANIKG